jgi:hypothetical protein
MAKIDKGASCDGEKMDGSVQSVDRVLTSSKFCQQNMTGWRDLDRKPGGLHKSTAHRLLSTLAARGYVARTADGITKSD